MRILLNKPATRTWTWLRQLSTSLPASAFEQKGPLAGIKVLDLTRVLAGPFATQMLADNGADVIKIEIPKIGDDTRHWKDQAEQEFWKDDTQTSLYFASCNRGKRSIAVNLKQKEGVEIIKRLAKVCDVVVDNYLPGKLDELGIGYSVLSKINPKIIHASISGYATSGPYEKRAGYDVIAAAEAGLLHITGERNGPPVKPGVALVDLCTGLNSYGAIASALYARQFTGVGQRIEASLFETQISLLVNLGSNYLNMGREAVRFGCGHPSIVPYDTFTCSDAYIVLGATSNRQWQILCNVLKRPDLIDDERFATNPSRVAHRKEVTDILNEAFSTKTVNDWCEELKTTGLPFGPVNNLEGAFDHPQIEPRKMIETLKSEESKSGELRVAGIPVKYSHTIPSIKGPPPSLGQHTNSVMEELGYSLQEVEALKASKIVE